MRTANGSRRSQDSQLEQLELDIAGKRLTLSRNGETVSTTLRSRARLGLVAYFVAARRDGRDNGFRTDCDVVAEAPGWTGVRHARSVGKKISALFNEWDGYSLVLDAPNGPTVPPWRVSIEPRSIKVIDEQLLHRLLAERQDVPPRAERRTSHAAQDTPDERTALADAEDAIIRGLDAGALRAQIQRAIAMGEASRDPAVRAEAARVEATRLRRQGRLQQAQRRATQALAFFHESGDLRRAAATLNELGAVAYRRGKMSDAKHFFLQELETLSHMNLDESHLAASRSLRCLALVALRNLDFEDGIRSARLAADAAARCGDLPGRLLAKAVELRLLAHRGGVSDASTAALHLQDIVNVVPASDPALLVFCRRLLCEVLYLVEDDKKADALAAAILRDAEHVGSARDADAVIKLLHRRKRSALIKAMGRQAAPTGRDNIDDHLIISTAEANATRRADTMRF